MPTRAPTPCPRPMCPHLRPCPEHQPKPWEGSTRRALDSLTAKDRHRIRDRDRWTCQTCGRPGSDVDHIVPLARGGSNDEANLQVLCVPCHQRKSAHEGVEGRLRRR